MATAQQVHAREINPDALNALIGRAVQDMGAALQAPLILIGDKLGLYRAMGDGTPMTAKKLAKKTGTSERYIREWLNANAAGQLVQYDAAKDEFYMTPEQAMVMAQDDSPVHLPGFYHLLASVVKDEEKLTEIYRTGKGMGWHEHEKGLFEGTERFFRPTYLANLVSSWIPALEGVEAKLKEGARVADIGCGHGASTLLMAKQFPKSKFFGFDYHKPSIEKARKKAKEAGVSDRVTFAVASAKDFPGKDYDLVAFFDCLHDMGDPVGAAKHVKQTLAKGGAGTGGTWMIVEPFAHDDAASNHNPIGRIFYSASATVCVPCSLAQEVGLGLGAQAGPARMETVTKKGGLKHFRKAAETPFNLVYEVRA
jgi:SAM-dependent methyltransferase